MKAFAPRPATAGPIAQPGQAAALADNRPAARAQRQLQAAIDGSPRQVAAAQLAAPRRNATGLPAQLKAGVENLSGYSLDDVRVHYNSAQPAQLQALAYAQGTDIHVAPGQEKHLPHEAWHVVQQKQGRVRATRQLKGVAVNDDTTLEREADVLGKQALAAASQPPGTQLRTPVVSAGQRARKGDGARTQPVAQRTVVNGEVKLSVEEAREQVEARLKSKLNARQQARLAKLCQESSGTIPVVQAAELLMAGSDDDHRVIAKGTSMLERATRDLLSFKGQPALQSVIDYTRSVREAITLLFHYFLSTDARTENESFLVLVNASLAREELALSSDLDAGIAVGSSSIDNYHLIYETFREVAGILETMAGRAGLYEGSLRIDGNLPAARSLDAFVKQCQLNNNILNDILPIVEIGKGNLTDELAGSADRLKRDRKGDIAETTRDILRDDKLKPSAESRSLVPGSAVDIKASYLRSITLLTRDMATLFDIRATSTRDRLAELPQFGLPKDLAGALISTLNFLLPLRNRLHAHYGGENDVVYIKKGFMSSFFSGAASGSAPKAYYANEGEINELRAAGSAVSAFRGWVTDALRGGREAPKSVKEEKKEEQLV